MTIIDLNQLTILIYVVCTHEFVVTVLLLFLHVYREVAAVGCHPPPDHSLYLCHRQLCVLQD